LDDKRQTDQQQKQTFHSISLYYEIDTGKSSGEIALEKKSITPEAKKDHINSTNADWTAAYDTLNSEIKIRHYSSKTLRTYRGWVRQFQGFSKSK